MVRVDPGYQLLLAKLSNFEYHFTRIGNNYNQITRALHQNFEPDSARKMTYALGELTRQLHDVMLDVLRITRQLQEHDRRD